MIAQELFGLDVSCENFTCGMNVQRILCISSLETRATFPLVAYKGNIVDIPFENAIMDFHLDTVIIKSGNAIDHESLVGVIVAGYDGGVIAKVLGHSVSQGVRIICPLV